MILKFKDILPNPNRDLINNPLNPDKVNELVDSINETGFWDNVVVRLRAKDHRPECAYGHTRIAAAIKVGLIEGDFIVKDLGDEMMIKIMGRENSDTYKYSVLALLEKVRAVVIGLADGRVKPFVINDKTDPSVICYAPSFIPGEPSSLSGGKLPPQEVERAKKLRYTAAHIAHFLGMSIKYGTQFKPDNNFKAAFSALRAIQNGLMCNEEVKGWTVNELLKGVRERTDKHTAMLKHEAAKAAVVKQAGMTTQQRVDEEKARKAEQKAAQEILDKQHAADVEKILEEKARQEVESAKQAKKDNLAREKRRKEVEEQFEKDRQSIANSAKALQQAEHLRSKREEAARSSFEKTLREIISRFFSEENPAVEMQKRGNKTRTDKERELLDVVLDRGHDWIEYARKHNRIEPKKKETK